jgi:MoaA/NifB/PqqE/SkfB family radical SAM enzyme
MLISLDGNPDFHKGTKTNEVEDVLKGIKLVQRNGTRVWLSTVLLEGSLAQMDFLISICRDYGTKMLLQPFDNSLIELEPFEKKLQQQRLVEVFDYVLDKAPEVVANTPDFVRMIREDKWLTPDMCLAGERTCFINSNGDVFACLPILLRNGPTRNGLRDGWIEAFEGITLDGCLPCRFPCMAELYNVFSMKPRTWMHMQKIMQDVPAA